MMWFAEESSVFPNNNHNGPYFSLHKITVLSQVHHFDTAVFVYGDVGTLFEQRGLFGVGVEPGQGAVGDVVKPVVGSEDKEARLVELGRTDDGNCFWKHQLVGHVSVQVHRAQEGSLGGVGVNLEKIIKKQS